MILLVFLRYHDILYIIGHIMLHKTLLKKTLLDYDYYVYSILFYFLTYNT